MMMDPMGNSSLRNYCSCFHEKIADLPAILDDVSHQVEFSASEQASCPSVITCSDFLFFSSEISSMTLSYQNSRKQNGIPPLIADKDTCASLSVFCFGEQQQPQISV